MAPRRLIGGLALAGLALGLVLSCRTPGLPAAEHFPLTGAHERAACGTCHTVDLITELPRQCSGCHTPDLPTPHFAGECDTCHNTTTWQDARVDHDALPPGMTCASCHEPDRPNPHPDGDCVSCHNTISWEDAVFRHETLAADTTCASCHEPDRPIAHYAGDCKACHNTISWGDATFSHATLPAGATCTSCHEVDRPAAHYAGDCAACHDTVAWENGTFDHDPFFPIPHRGVSACAECHPVSTADFTCLNCHEHRRSEADDEHRGMRNYAYDTQRCLDCHPQGRE